MLPYYGICVHIDLSQVRCHIGFYIDENEAVRD